MSLVKPPGLGSLTLPVSIANGGTGSNALANHGILVAGPASVGVLAPGTSGNIPQSNGTDWVSTPLSVDLTNLNSFSRPEVNFLSNPGFNFAQQQTPGTLTTIANATYGPDCWKSERSSADVQYQRVSNSGVAGYISGNRGRWKKITNAGQVVIYQVIENLKTLELLNQSIGFQITTQFNVARTFRMALINYSGAADTIPAMISNFTTSPMGLNANFAILASTLNTSGVNTVDSWLTGVTMPGTGISNLILAIMIEDSMAINDTVDLAQAKLYTGVVFRSFWEELSAPEDQARVERFYEKSYDIDTPPATVSAVSSINGTQTGTTAVTPVRFRQRKPKSPAITLYSSGGTGAAGKWRDTTGAADLTATAQNTGLAATAVKLTAGTNLNDFAGHFTADAQL